MYKCQLDREYTDLAHEGLPEAYSQGHGFNLINRWIAIS